MKNICAEIRDDFYVDTERKMIWMVLLDMLSAVDTICKKHNIPYYAVGGTLLGAVRHGGFIPWDDDLDVAMLRSDYDRFLKAAEKELSGKYFLQTTLTDIHYYREHARIRNSETTGICEHYELHGCNNGIFLDILPLENFSDTFSGRFHSDLCRTLGRILNIKVHHNTRPRNSWRSHLIYACSFLFPLKATHRLREYLETQNGKRSADKVTLGDVYYSMYPRERLTYNKSDFASIVELPFEDIRIPAPAGYHNILKTAYGDYMKFPPVEKRGTFHSIVFDPVTPYSEYIEKHYPAARRRFADGRR